MAEGAQSAQPAFPPEPRWPSAMGLIAVGGLQLALPSHLVFGPAWLVLTIVCVLAAATTTLHHTGRHDASRIGGYLLSTVVTLAMISSLGLLVAGLPSHRDSAQDLLYAATGLWISNILVFASWYWRLDGGGPSERHRRKTHNAGSFLFPQMTMSPESRAAAGLKYWRPGFVDYLFLAFNTSTALSPTDVPVLSRWAKGMMMVQAMISLSTIVILAGRAVNVL
ncbi:DUF1345 domain-containing protein [Paludibaculum fermentans]|uniref:DUF1345 domain-containing protein n=1 Tax=Paludibaculum fermentans TaxID=1473598 RepID=A0A7S7NTD1_PALFE|nr:DUF1345 domain-containing protein [Paludibaculum fermentans]QOY89351.1 DUF1345 domain-containing protein [Paludibaculum fermentans]